MTVAGLVLAAGAGRRLGRPKALVEWAGEPLVRRAVRLLRAGGCDPVHVVVGAGAGRLPPLPGAVAVVNPQWRDGLGSSLLCGLDSLPGAADAVVVVLVDQPWLTSAAVRRVRAAYAAGAAVAVASYAGRPGHPVLLSRITWPLLAPYATGDRGARDFLRARADLVTSVPCDGSPADVDTPADLARVRARHQA
ncbi:NTP transferase domain-containing protein [Micromonospora sp. DR5-3]|uniref:nucleotidyltransferase family protein n=1 Tax=unclassified Micromonospora TaxID=2617518 RepID=UPI0011DB3819|nr:MULTISPECIES: NTP transferase domain-containing protein [unclassified Micromonospora]MCW3819442.1 NTP transferase domain-containing protein [Micromonospora sp. DR5-3]TYC20773.1 NTP transferase domain-containing protein [Micromonospora sp. MP36]